MNVLAPTLGTAAPLSRTLPAEAPGRVGAGGFREQLSRALHEAPPADPRPASPVGGVGEAAASLVARAVESQRRLDGVLAQARAGRTFSPQELLALQATVYRHTTTLEVLGKAVEQVSSAVKQTLGTQV